MTHRQIIKEYQKAIILKDKVIVDWGSGSKPVQRYITHENCRFITLDNANITDDRQGNLHYKVNISKPLTYDFNADVAFCMEVLEHVEYPEIVLKNIYDNLKQGGTLYLSAPFKYEVHSDIDYWRYTDAGLKLLLERNGFKVDYILTTTDDLGWIVKARK